MGYKAFYRSCYGLGCLENQWEHNSPPPNITSVVFYNILGISNIEGASYIGARD